MIPNTAELPPGNDTSCDDRILVSLRRIIRAVDLYSRYLALRYSLTGPQLVCIRNLLRFGPTAPGALARRISLSPATVTGIVDRLEKRGLVTRARSLDDKRKVEIALTPEGRALAGQMPPPLHETFSRRLGALPIEEQEEIDRVLAKIVGMMEDQDFGNAPLYPADGPLQPPALAPFLDNGIDTGEPLKKSLSEKDRAE